jgi:hypothetical protein
MPKFKFEVHIKPAHGIYSIYASDVIALSHDRAIIDTDKKSLTFYCTKNNQYFVNYDLNIRSDKFCNDWTVAKYYKCTEGEICIKDNRDFIFYSI